MLRSLLILSLSFTLLAAPAGATILAQAGGQDLGQGFSPVSICQNGTFGDSIASATCSAGRMTAPVERRHPTVRSKSTLRCHRA